MPSGHTFAPPYHGTGESLSLPSSGRSSADGVSPKKRDLPCGLIWDQVVTIFTLVLHFLHPFLCVITLLSWVRTARDDLGGFRVSMYLILVIAASLSYLLLSSVFYMWALRHPEDPSGCTRRRLYGIMINLVLADIPLFSLEVDILWAAGFQSTAFALSFLVTCISFGYSSMRTWVHIMHRFIKSQSNDTWHPISDERWRELQGDYNMAPPAARTRGAPSTLGGLGVTQLSASPLLDVYTGPPPMLFSSQEHTEPAPLLFEEEAQFHTRTVTPPQGPPPFGHASGILPLDVEKGYRRIVSTSSHNR